MSVEGFKRVREEVKVQRRDAVPRVQNNHFCKKVTSYETWDKMVVTFVPFFDVAKIYGIMRLKHKNKQITECIQLIKALQGEVKGYANHAATLMWAGHVDALKTYHNIMLRLWYAEGYKGSRKEYEVDEENAEWPWWWGWDTLALSHKLSLYRKRKTEKEYTPAILELDEALLPLKNTCGYIWPSHLIKKYGHDYDYIMSLGIEELCVPPGEGAPIQYRWSLEEVCAWEQDESRNPRTGRALTSTSKVSIYGQLQEARAYYLGAGLLCRHGPHTFYWTLELVRYWLEDLDANPVTGDPIALDDAIYQELTAAEAYYRREYYLLD